MVNFPIFSPIFKRIPIQGGDKPVFKTFEYEVQNTMQMDYTSNLRIYYYRVWVLKKREEQSLEAAQMKFLRHLIGVTKLDKEKDQCIRGKNGRTEHSTGNNTVPGKVATTCTEDGHRQTTKTSTTI